MKFKPITRNLTIILIQCLFIWKMNGMSIADLTIKLGVFHFISFGFWLTNWLVSAHWTEPLQCVFVNNGTDQKTICVLRTRYFYTIHIGTRVWENERVTNVMQQCICDEMICICRHCANTSHYY